MYDLEQVLSESFDYQVGRLFTAIPAIIVNVNLSLQTVDLKIALTQRYYDDEDTEYPVLLGVPLLFQASKTSAITFPVAIGDTVLAVFCQRSIDTFKSGSGQITSPSDYRMYSARDAVAIPGLFPFALARNNPNARSLPHSTSDTVVTHNIGTGSEAEVRIKASGEVSITSPLKVTVTAPTSEFTGDVTVGGTLTAGTDVLTNGISLKTHRHGGVTTGGGTTATPI